MSRVYLGKLDTEKADEFTAKFPDVIRGSLSNDKKRRLFVDSQCESVQLITTAFIEVSGDSLPIESQQVLASGNIHGTCRHRGSQRFAECCSEKRVNQWICRKRKTDKGNPVDCVQAVVELTRSGSSNAVVACEECEFFEA